MLVVVDPPLLDDAACRCHAAEQVLVEAFVAEAAVQALDEAVLGWLAGCPLDREPPRCHVGRMLGLAPHHLDGELAQGGAFQPDR